MEENKEMLEVLKSMEKNSRRQLWCSRLACLFALAAVVFCALAFARVAQLLPQVNTILAQTESVLGNLEQTTAELAKVDLAGMVADVDTLVASGQQSLEQTMEKLNTVDFDALNEAIASLSAVVEPLAKFFGAFR